MSTSKHYTYHLNAEGKPFRLPTKTGVRMWKRRSELFGAVETGLRNGASLRDSLQEAVRLLGSRPADRRWVYAYITKGAVTQ